MAIRTLKGDMTQPTGRKTLTSGLERKIRQAKKQLEKHRKSEQKAIGRWRTEHILHITNAERLADITRHGTEKEKQLKAKIRAWRERSRELTNLRNAAREQMKKSEELVNKLSTDLIRLQDEIVNQTKITDDIVTQIFGLNEAVVTASKARMACLTRHVFPRLIGEDGKLRSRVTFTTKDGTRRVIARVNSMTIVKGDLAAEAEALITKFIERFQKPAGKIDPAVKALFDLTSQILIKRITFKVGPDLGRFLGVTIDETIFPELARAQALLRLSVESEKTNSYIRIYQRKDAASQWVAVPQS